MHSRTFPHRSTVDSRPHPSARRVFSSLLARR